MSDNKKFNFYSPSLGNISFEKMIEEIFAYMNKFPEKIYEIVVGCDSSSGGVSYSFPVAVVVLRKGEGGRFFLKKIKYSSSSDQKKYANLHQRILQEVVLSCELALSLREALEDKAEKNAYTPNYEFQYIHADVGENGKTKDMIKEVVGLIKSNGFEAKIKPESYAASIVADRFT